MTPFDPVTIWETASRRRVVADVEAAARCLTDTWPGDRRQKAYAAACQACLDALEGKATAAAARAAFVKAAKSSGILDA